MTYENDPLWRMRHALAGVTLALFCAVPTAALLGSWVADRFADSYTLRVSIYGVLLLYVVVGAGVLFSKVARHETRPVSVARVGLWFTSLWLWPLLFVRGRGGPTGTA